MGGSDQGERRVDGLESSLQFVKVGHSITVVVGSSREFANAIARIDERVHCKTATPTMSETGHERRFCDAWLMSAYPPTADI
jgi:hypothetical protein